MISPNRNRIMRGGVPRASLSHPLHTLVPMGYRGKVAEQERARELRARGWTYKEICAELRVARGSVSAWVRDVEVDEVVWAQRARKNRNVGARTKRPHRQAVEKQVQ